MIRIDPSGFYKEFRPDEETTNLAWAFSHASLVRIRRFETEIVLDLTDSLRPIYKDMVDIIEGYLAKISVFDDIKFKILEKTGKKMHVLIYTTMNNLPANTAKYVKEAK